MTVFQMHQTPSKIQNILDKLVSMSKAGEVNFAFAFAYPDQKSRQWFEAHTGGNVDTLKAVFPQDALAVQEAQLRLRDHDPKEKIYFHLPPTLLKD